ncbi:MAG: SoxR reducing system RseC family protein [Clostridia bacterium]|nr:SoxR reducing system RseC family protein [Clostridia bacterium]
MKTRAKVLSVEGSLAEVEVVRMSACEGCHKSEEGSCSVCSLMGNSKKTTTVKADNRLGAAVGDIVFVESSSGRMLLYAACLFLLPLILFALGFWIASLLTDAIWVYVVAGFGGALLAFLGVGVYSNVVASKRVDVQITEVISSASQSEKD